MMQNEVERMLQMWLLLLYSFCSIWRRMAFMKKDCWGCLADLRKSR